MIIPYRQKYRRVFELRTELLCNHIKKHPPIGGCGELHVAEGLDNFEVIQTGRPCPKIQEEACSLEEIRELQDCDDCLECFVDPDNPSKEDFEWAKFGLATAREKAKSCDMLILDEIIYALNFCLIKRADMINLIKNRPASLDIILTGRDAHKELVELADYLKPLAVMAYYTGMRRGEILALKWSRVNLFRQTIDLTPQDTKTAESRIIYFKTNPNLKQILVDAAKTKKRGQRQVFVKPGGAAVPKWYMERLFKKACIAAEVGPFRFHDLRHTFNTNMLKAGVSTQVIMKLTGHKTDAMFTRYTHLDEELGTDAIDKLVAFMQGRKADKHDPDRKKESN